MIVGTNWDGVYNEGYRWSQSDGYTLLGDLPGGGVGSPARNISGNGKVIVGSSSSVGSIDWGEAYRWTEEDGIVGLGDFAGGAFQSIAYDASYDGQVLVGFGTSARGEEAFYWRRGIGMQSLQELLALNGIDVSGWQLTVATGVSDDGNWIAGTGRNPSGQLEAFRVYLPRSAVPEPSSFLLTTAILGCLLGLRPRYLR